MRTGPRIVDWQRDSPFSNQGMEGGGYAHHAGLSSLCVHTQIFTNQLTLFQPGGTDYAHLITTGTPRFSDLPTALWCNAIFYDFNIPTFLKKSRQIVQFTCINYKLKKCDFIKALN